MLGSMRVGLLGIFSSDLDTELGLFIYLAVSPSNPE